MKLADALVKCGHNTPADPGEDVEEKEQEDKLWEIEMDMVEEEREGESRCRRKR